MLTTEELAAIEKRLEAATEGPWPLPDELQRTEKGHPDYYDPRRPLDHEGCDVWPWHEEADMVFAYKAREDVSALLADLKLYKAALEEAVRVGGLKIVTFSDGTDHLDSADQVAYELASDSPALATILKGVKG